MCHFQLGHTGDKSVCEDAASFCWPVVNASSISSPAGVGKKKIDISANISVHAMALNSLANFDDSQEMKGNNVLHNREASY